MGNEMERWMIGSRAPLLSPLNNIIYNDNRTTTREEEKKAGGIIIRGKRGWSLSLSFFLFCLVPLKANKSSERK